MNTPKQTISIIGGGPAGLMAAERLAGKGVAVTVYDRMPSVARKFLMAGRGGLNLTHSEELPRFMTKYGAASERLASAIHTFPPAELRRWCEELGQPTFVGSSGRVFPTAFKASPLLRAWLKRLEKLGVKFAMRHSWLGWNEKGDLLFDTPEGQKTVASDSTLFALGGASWPRLGSDGGWASLFTAKGITVAPLRPANCGFVTTWSDYFRQRFPGQPLKGIALSFQHSLVRGEAMVTENGLEGGAIYALSSVLRSAIETSGKAVLHIDLRPDITASELVRRLAAPRGSQSGSTYLKRVLGLSPVAIALLHENGPVPFDAPEALAKRIKELPVTLTATAPIDRAISSAGGIALEAVTDDFMLRAMPGTFVAGEMLDWEAPTGGYLLQASFSTAVAAANGMQAWLKANT